ncbi:MAG: type II toxin-antitoxin system prevent-host-death family antitoxin [Phenylobacterium sp.]|nr:type II toxin-antitoxin system prevent-host-death family antitoxin [Phenylobacterium sp.]
MQVPVSQAKGQLLDLVRRAEAGEEVELTRHGIPVVKLVGSAGPKLTPQEKLQFMQDLVERARSKALPGPCAARSADFLYDDETGLPA